MADHPTISKNGPDQGLPALPSNPPLTRRTLLGGAGIAVGAVLASPGMPVIAPAAAQPVSAEPRPLDVAFRHRALEVREACARANNAIPIAPHPTNGDEARYPTRSAPTRGAYHTTNAAKWTRPLGRPSPPPANRATPQISRRSRSAALADWLIP